MLQEGRTSIQISNDTTNGLKEGLDHGVPAMFICFSPLINEATRSITLQIIFLFSTAFKQSRMKNGFYLVFSCHIFIMTVGLVVWVFIGRTIIVVRLSTCRYFQRGSCDLSLNFHRFQPYVILASIFKSGHCPDIILLVPVLIFLTQTTSIDSHWMQTSSEGSHLFEWRQW